MKAALQALAAVLAGLLVGFVLVIAVELFGSVAHPLPEDFDGSTEQMCRHVERIPSWVLAAVIPAWAGTAFASTLTAGKIGGLYSAAIVGLLILAALLLNISMLPYPMWFKIGNVLAVSIAILASCNLSRRHRISPSNAGGCVPKTRANTVT